jgi:GalNAc-alpha-(1->4)-GalNAc-alpha-(1->3)-diNAcBac-PP-undecaprenol alpha-1,4-N-acetyl-D-galactosaminyltransferase
MKITFITASLGSGGSERVVSLLANNLSERGNQVEIICLKYNDVFYPVNANVRVTLAKECITSDFIGSELFWLRKHIQTSNTNIVIAFTEGVYCFTLCALMGTKMPVISSERNDPRSMAAMRKVLRHLFLPHTDWLVVQTNKIKAYFPQRLQTKTSIIYNPVNEHVFNLVDETKSNRIISVARLYPQKNQKIMIDAFAKIANEFPTYNLIIFGEGPMRGDLEKQIQNLQMQKRIFLPGRSQNVIDEMNKSKLFCLSSDYEGMSNSMIEAVCVGLPIVSTRVSGTEELVNAGKNGLLVDCGNSNALAAAMENILADDEKMKDYSEYSKGMGENFKLDNIVDQWLIVIKKVINKKSKNE